ncbi:hypothetical protein [Fimbriimonas ginsengisoli]|uniref:Uncharacterized protein n=1 Tax=Fimbriimonas ginsengisoli Gsoil 348 TaxID=661478 RepID=A0A068NPM2_FIMGI|nr:hypothetical protein [Fimbriimonas ginsengisoli]AIE83524.1 hypothetical protein OP10G_0156 [Fimbriimonas ginsengisoli Gsoil 348]
MPRGGKREGAGRKSKDELYGRKVRIAENKISDRLPTIREDLEIIAHGAEQVEEEWVEACTVTVDDVRQMAGGQFAKIKRPAFPDAKPGELVMIRRKIIKLPPDYRANAYLFDRVGGKPTEKVEVDTPAESPLVAAFGTAIAKIYGPTDDTSNVDPQGS